MKEQIEEIAKVLCEYHETSFCKSNCNQNKCCEAKLIAETLYKAGYRKQICGEWKCADRKGISLRGYMVCSVCDVMIPTCDDGTRYCLDRLRYCPECGAKMKGGGER